MAKANQQADALSRLCKDAETLYHNDYNDIPVFLVDVTPDKTDSNIVESDFSDLNDDIMDEGYATQEALNPHNAAFPPSEEDKVVSAQIQNRFHTGMRLLFNKGGVRTF